MELKPGALSPDGYIIDQRQTDNIPFGRLTSDKNGCGWIACYNFLLALGRHPDPGRLLGDLARTLPLGGYLGVHVLALIRELRRQQVPLNFALRPIHAQTLVEQAPAGIILYRAGRHNHYAAFRREEDGTLRFFGAEYGRARHRSSLAGFYWDHVKFPLALVITAAPRGSIQTGPGPSGEIFV